MDISTISVSEFTQSLASKTSVPGGGGASALAASVAIALGDMVGEYTLGKKKYAHVEDEIAECMVKAQDLRVRLLACIEKDALAFEPLSKAYSIPKDKPDRDAIMEDCLKAAADVPLEILMLSAEAMELLVTFSKKGSVIVVSDAATGAAILAGAMKGAAVNVKINSKSMKDREYADRLNEQVDQLLAKYLPLADKIYDTIYGSY